MIVRSPLPDVPIAEMNASEFILQRLSRHPKRIGFIEGATDRQYTNEEIIKLTKKVANNLRKRNLTKNEVMVMLVPNCLEFVPLALAVPLLGAIYSGVNPDYTVGEIDSYLTDCGVSRVLVTSKTLKKLKQTKVYSRIKEVYVTDSNERSGKVYPFTDLLQGEYDRFPPQAKINPKTQPGYIFYSSGTTGMPKAALISHYNMVAACTILTHESVGMVPTNEIGVTQVVYPIFHAGGSLNMLMMMTAGFTAVIYPSYDYETLLHNISKYKVTHGWLVPAIINRMAKDPKLDQYDLSSLTYMQHGSSPISQDVIRTMQRRVPSLTRINHTYGMTENLAVCMGQYGNNNKAGSCGKPFPNTIAKVIDVSTGEMLGPNESGEICTKSPGMMLGYLNKPKETAETIDKNGWLHTGDIGYYDKYGNFFIVDRLKELIKYKSFQVAPAELETVLLRHPAVMDVAVVGIPDERAGEVPKAFVVKKSDEAIAEAELQGYLAEQLIAYKHLRGGVEFVNEIPKAPSTGKPLRRVLRESTIKRMAVSSKL